VVGAIVPLRVNEEDEYDGLDRSEHAESAYAIAELGSTKR
jgi:ammonia channel protein AmtB